jgi:hypothetical protein
MTATLPTAPAATKPLLCPFDLSVDFIDRMLNFEIAGDPLYSGLEVQSFNDPRHGHGMVVLLTRREDGRVDCYRQAGLAVDPAGYQIGGGLGEWIETTISPPHARGRWRLLEGDAAGGARRALAGGHAGLETGPPPPLMRLVTRVAPVFREWPTTYRWRATLRLGEEPLLSARWERTSAERGESYRRITGTQ